MTDRQSRAAGALYGLAIGDALGMPTQLLPRPQIVGTVRRLPRRFPAGAARPSARRRDCPRARSPTTPSRPCCWPGSSSTVRRRSTPASWPDARWTWEESMRARGSLDLLGPSTKRALAELLAGSRRRRGGPLRHHQRGRDADHPGRHRRAGLRPRRPGGPGRRGLPSDAQHRRRARGRRRRGRGGERRDRRRHRSRGRPVRRAAAGSRPGAATGSPPPTWPRASGGPPTWSTGCPPSAGLERVYTLVGTSLATQESVPAAFAVPWRAPGRPWRACLLAASARRRLRHHRRDRRCRAGACHGEEAFPAAGPRSPSASQRPGARRRRRQAADPEGEERAR